MKIISIKIWSFFQAALKDRLTSEIQEIKSKESTAGATRTTDAVNVKKDGDELMNYNLLMKPLNVQLQGRTIHENIIHSFTLWLLLD